MLHYVYLNVVVTSQVLQFVVAHIDVFSGILRERHPILHTDALKELALVTGVVGRAALDGRNLQHKHINQHVDSALTTVRLTLMLY